MDSWDIGDGRLLIVHSNAATRDTLSLHLKEAGHTALVAEARGEGLELAKAHGLDLVFLEVNGEGADAEQFLASLRGDRASRTIPVILLAAELDTEVIERCLSAGADDYLLAPYSTTLMRAQVRDFLGIGRRRRQEQLQQEQEDLRIIERDVQIARQIQAGFLPSELPQPEGWDVAARFHPAREVAGDFYDAFMLTHGRRVGLVIADICDKGVGAALFMALFRSLIRAYSQQNYSMRWMDILDDDSSRSRTARQRMAPSAGADVLKNAMDLTNEYIARNHEDANMFATMFFAVLDPVTGMLMYVNGGHNPPAVVGRPVGAGEAPIAVKARLKPTGPAVGMFPNVDYRIGRVTLEPGDMLFAFTDGVTDAKDPQGTLFGEKRMLALVQESTPSAAALLDRLDEALHAHMAEAHQFDDITMLAALRKPPRDR